MELSLGPKQTEIGQIPHQWQLIPIGKAGEVVGGRQRSPHAVGNACKYLRVANVFDGWLKTEDVLEMPFTASEKERFQLKVGDILLCEGQSTELVGRSAIYRGVPPGCCFQNTLLRFRANAGTSTEFAQLVFQRYLGLGTFAAIALQTTSIAHLGAARFAALKMPLPPLPEQRAIAAALSDVDSLIGALDGLIAKKRDLKQATMQQLLTGQRRLPGFRGEWELKRLSDVGACLRGVSYRGDSDLFPRDTTQTRRLLRANNVQGATVVTTDAQFVNRVRVSPPQVMRQNDILVCMANESYRESRRGNALTQATAAWA